MARLAHFKDKDLIQCIAYLQKVLVCYNIALALISKRANTRKTTFIVKLVLSILKEDVSKPAF